MSLSSGSETAANTIGTLRVKRFSSRVQAEKHNVIQGPEACSALPHLLVGQHGASQAWPLPQKPIALALLSNFPRNGVPDPNEDEFYEVVFDEDAGHFVMRRRVDERTGGLPTRIGRPSRSRRSATGRARRSAPGAQVPAMAASQLNACARRGPGKLWLTFRSLAQAFSSRRTCESRFPRAIFERRRHPPRKLR